MIDSRCNKNWNRGFGGFASFFVFNSDIFLFFILATEADNEDSGVVHERGQPPSSSLE